MSLLAAGAKIRFAIMFIQVTMFISRRAQAAIIYETGESGPTGVSSQQLANEEIAGVNINKFVFAGGRFRVEEATSVERVGGHFLGRAVGFPFFGSIVRLTGNDDFPDSVDLTTPDVVGVTTLNFPNPSANVYGTLTATLSPGWYALVFGSGLYGHSGIGAAVSTGSDYEATTYIAWEVNLGDQWMNLDAPFENFWFVVEGAIVPEPATLLTASTLAVAVAALRRTVSPKAGPKRN